MKYTLFVPWTQEDAGLQGKTGKRKGPNALELLLLEEQEGRHEEEHNKTAGQHPMTNLQTMFLVRRFARRRKNNTKSKKDKPRKSKKDNTKSKNKQRRTTTHGRAVPGARCTAAIDFGTTNSGAAYKLAQASDNDVTALQFPGESNIKVPTSVVVERQAPHNAVGFGPSATSRYEEGLHAIFHRFKMQLYKNSRAKTLKADVGDLELPTDLVIARCLGLLKDMVLQQIKDRNALTLSAYEVQWVLTVPAIWVESSKALMRRAAFKAGLIDTETSDRLLLALEPECAALDCHETLAADLLKKKTRFVVVDCGGGTVDTAAFEVMQPKPNVRLEAALPPRGGNWGSTRIDEKFLEFLRELLDNPPCLRANTFAVFDMLTSVWEDRKVNFDVSRLSDPDARLRINLNPVLQEMDRPPKLVDAVARYNRKHPGANLKCFGAASLKLTAAHMKTFYDEVLNDIKTHVRELLRDMGRTDYVVLVGGFGGSSFVRDAVREVASESGVQVLIPPRPWASIVMGAVRFGLSRAGSCDRHGAEPALVIVRRSPLTYGFGTTKNVTSFKADHPGVSYDGRTEFNRDAGQDQVLDVFSTFVKVNDQVPVDREVKHTVYPLRHSQTSVRVDLVSCPRSNVVFTDEHDVEQHGSCVVAVTERGNRSEKPIDVSMKFGETELMMFVHSRTTGAKERVLLDFDATA
ncbi:hypothetical protein PTSG_10884 [Salpingoeca rosetta]|uniref:Uncharacterized protein n=1 Tax=Salpingoeca rosetta (strain ATCC 50818 / BSB-021) TaxID=946362 RepID=F2URA2_SALR5|nr:uncharacterized protein PTSG_10884 [Salpingoeca rosetta]EGD80205.1 hypothetical protein PTSG_10884 [Salpingoeca rosetta]|eukprot:XP_004988267.1 hypothetical protein PTSG_10884 [Salpingoeca rosetta]